MWNNIRWYAGVWLLASSKWCYDKLQERAPSVEAGSFMIVMTPLILLALILLGLRQLGRYITGPQWHNVYRVSYLDYIFHD